MVHSSEYKRRTRLELISVSYLVARKSILGCVHRTSSLAAVSSLAFSVSTIAAIIALYCRDKIVHSPSANDERA